MGTGGSVGTGGAVGTGGVASYNCSAAIVPANGTSGMVTDFSDYNEATGHWGKSSGIFGSIYSYAGTSATMNAAKVEGTPKGLHLAGSVPANSYAGGGLTFLACATVASFTQIQFSVYGNTANCAVELQVQTFDQRPTDQTPPGGCASNCFNFPVLKQIIDLSTAVAASSPKTVVKSLSSFSNWSSTNAAEVVGLQWQFTRASSSGTCTADVTVTEAKFLP
jgi:hypothetical protein